MSDRGFTERFIQGNWHHLTGTGNRRNKSWSQTATTRRALQSYLPVAMRNLIQIFCPNLPDFNCSSISAQFTCHHIIYSSAPCMQRPLCSATSICPTSFCIWLTHVRLISIIVINIAFLPVPRPDATRQRGYNQARNILRGLVGLSFFGQNTLN